MKMFEALDKLDKQYKNDKIDIPIEVPKNAIDKTTDIKNYKRNYYLQNIEIYTERNRLYRLRKKEQKKNI